MRESLCFSSPKFHGSLYLEFYNWRPTLACPRPDDSSLLRLVWLASVVATGELPSLRDFFFPVQRFLHSPAFSCCLKPHLPFPVSWFFHSLSVFAFFLPCVRSPVVWFGSAFLSCPRAFSVRSKEKKFFPLSFPFSCFATVAFLFFHSTVLMAQQKQLVLPDRFSGRSHDDFDIWVSQFDLAAAVNQWSQVTKLQMLPLRLKGPALRAFHAIPAEDRRTYAKATDALQNRFSPVERQSVHRAALRSRRRKPDEDLSELADDVLLLAGRAYPGMDSDALNQLALDAFLDALDVQLRRRVRDADPETLNAAVSRALVLDAYDEADRRSGLSNTQAQRSTHHGQPALAASSVDPPRESPSVSDTVLQNLLSTQQQILESNTCPCNRSVARESRLLPFRRARSYVFPVVKKATCVLHALVFPLAIVGKTRRAHPVNLVGHSNASSRL